MTITPDEKARLMENQLDTLRARSLDEQHRLETLEHRVEELERQLSLLIIRMQQHRREDA